MPRLRIGRRLIGGYLARGIIHHRPQQVNGLFLLCPAVVADLKKRVLPKHTTLVKKANYPQNCTLKKQECSNHSPWFRPQGFSREHSKKYCQESKSQTTNSQEEGNSTPSASRPLRLTTRGIQKWFVLGVSILVAGFIMRTASLMEGDIVAGVGFIIVIFAIVI